MRYLYSVVMVILFSAAPAFAAGIGASGEWEQFGKEGEMSLTIDEASGKIGPKGEARPYKINKAGGNWMVIVAEDAAGSPVVVKLTKKSENLMVLEQGGNAAWIARKGVDLVQPFSEIVGRWTGFLDDGSEFITLDYDTRNIILFDEDSYEKKPFAVMKQDGGWEHILTSDDEWCMVSRLAGGFLQVCERMEDDAGIRPDLSSCAVLEPAATATTGMDR